jgi:hypothetical protein
VVLHRPGPVHSCHRRRWVEWRVECWIEWWNTERFHGELHDLTGAEIEAAFSLDREQANAA